jgi:hypothetical protein
MVTVMPGDGAIAGAGAWGGADVPKRESKNPAETGVTESGPMIARAGSI